MKNLKKLIEWSKTKEVRDLFRESAKKTTHELIDPFYTLTKSLGKYVVLGVSTFGLYLGINYLNGIERPELHENSAIYNSNKEGECLKYIPRTGYFYCDSNKKIN